LIDTELRKQDTNPCNRVEMEVDEMDASEGEAVRRELNVWRCRGRRYEQTSLFNSCLAELTSRFRRGQR
jgi:hypothetical protein